jgi:hypothetical protein
MLDWILSIFEPPTPLLSSFRRIAKTFYPNAASLWNAVPLRDSKIHYMLASDDTETRRKVSDRLVYLSARCDTLAKKLTHQEWPGRESDVRKLKKCLLPTDGVSRIAQKPLGGYDVRAYAQGQFIFIELPTFGYIETGEDGINTTETRRRDTLFHIILHELAHVAGHWDHNADHEKCVAWLTTLEAS